MQKSPRFWAETLAQLGLARRKKSKRAHGPQPRSLRVQALEPREMLADYSLLGTSGDDIIAVQLCVDVQHHQWRVNSGAWQQITISSSDVLNVQGVGGHDMLFITGSSADEIGYVYPNSGSFHDKPSTPTYTVNWSAMEYTSVTGTSGDDDIHLYDSPGDDTFTYQRLGLYEEPAAILTGPGYTLDVMDFPYIVAHGDCGGGTDLAYLFGSRSHETLESNENFARMFYGGLTEPCVRALYFNEVHATGGDGHDSASLIGKSTSNDTVELYADGHGSITRTVGPGLTTILDGSFETMTAHGNGGGTDVAYLHDSNGDDDFIANPSSATLKSAAGMPQQYEIVANAFGCAHAYGDNGGHDRAWIYGSAGNDTMNRYTDRGIVRLFGSGFNNRAINFETIEAYGEGGTDSANYQDSSGDDVLETVLDESGPTPEMVTTFTGGDRFVSSRAFEQTTAGSLYGYDVAHLHHSSTPASDTVTSGPDVTRLTYPNSAYCEVQTYDLALVHSDGFADPDLLDAIRHALGLEATENVTQAHLAELTSLTLDSTKIDSLEGLEQAENLQTLTLIPSDLSETIELPGLFVLAGLTNLRSLTLQGLGLEDSELGSLGSLSNLQMLDLRHNHLSADAIPTSFGNLAALESLDLRYNRIDVVPTVIASLPALRSLYVHGNPIEDPRAALASLAGRLVDVDLAPDHPERASTISELADALYQLPIEMYEYAVNTIEFQPYQGAMKGPDAVLQTKVGNDWETAALLAGLLNEAGVNTRYVTGQVQAPIQDVQDWLGAADPDGCYRMLSRTGYAPIAVAGSGGAVTHMKFNYAWLEAQLPLGGSGYVGLAPSWKLREHRNTVVNMLSMVPFDLDPSTGDGTTNYFAQQREELPHEYYQRQVREYLAEQDSDLSIADLRYAGPIRIQTIAALPAALPFTVITSTVGDSTIPVNRQHRVEITVRDSSGTLFTRLLSIPDVSLSRLTIRPFDAGGDLAKPQLLIDGAVDTESSRNIAKTTSLTIEVKHYNGDNNATVDKTISFVRTAGEYLAFSLDAGQISAGLVTQQRREVNQAAIELVNGATPAVDVQIGGLLHLAGLQYWYDMDSGQDAICDMTGARRLYASVSSGLVSGDTTLQLLDPELQANLQIPFLPEHMIIDLPNGVGCAPSIFDASSYDQSHEMSLDDARFRMLGYEASAMEHAIWEDLTNIPTISTVKSFELARERSIPIYRIDSTNASTLIPQLTQTQAIKDAVQLEISRGSVVTIPRDETPLGNWDGVGYTADNTSQGYVLYAISDNLSGSITYGGYTTGTPLYVPPKTNPPAVQSSTLSYAGDPVDVASGTVIHDETDFAFPGLGFPLAMARHYQSSHTGTLDFDGNGTPDFSSDRGMGAGWSFTYSDRLTTSNDCRDPAGTKIWYTGAGDRLPFKPDGSGGYVTPESVYGSLSSDGSGGYRWTDKNGNRVDFNAAGRLTRMADRYGNGVSIAYNANGEITTVSDLVTPSRSLSFVYTGGHITSIRDFAQSPWQQRTWTYQYDANGRLWKVTSPSNAQTPQAIVQYAYYIDTARDGLLQTVTDPEGGQTSYTYYVNRRGFEVTDAEGNRHSLSYNIYRDRTAFTDERGQTTYYTHNDKGNVVEEVYPDQSNTTYNWQNSLCQSVTDAFGQTTKLWHDTRGNLVLQEDPEGGAKVLAYANLDTTLGSLNTLDWSADVGRRPDDSAPGVLAIEFDPSEIITFGSGGLTPIYEVLDGGNTLKLMGDTWKAIEIDYTITANTVLEFDFTSTAVGDLHCIGLDNDATFNWPRQFRLYGETAGGLTTFLDYAATASQTRHYVIPLHEFTGFHGHVSYLTFMNDDATLGSPSESVFSDVRIYDAPEGVAVHDCEYYADGSLWKAMDPLNNMSLYTYPTQNRGLPDSVLTPLGRLTTGDPDDYKTTYQYNSAGQVVGKSSRVSPEQWITVSYTYDPYGNQLTRTDGNGATTQYTYDLLGRQLTVTLPDPDDLTASGGQNGPLPRPVTTSTYDKLGNRETSEDTIGRMIRYEYDRMGRLLETTHTDTEDTVLTVSTMQYDPAGNLLSGTDELGRAVRYVYDQRGRRIVTVAPDGTAAYTWYDGGGRVVGQTDARGNLAEYRYDKLGRKLEEILPLANTLDDGATGFEAFGVWTVVSGCGGSDRDYRYAAGSSNYATWTFSGLRDDLVYELLITWKPDNVYASTVAPFAVFDGTTAGTQLSAVTVDQKQGPGEDLTHGDGWRSLGQFRSTTGTLTVKLTGVNLGRAVADAVCLVEPRTVTRYGYDARGNLRYVTDALGICLGDPNHTTQYEYDLAGRKTAVIMPDPDGTGTGVGRPVTYYTYDANSNLKTVTDPRGSVTTYYYDELDRTTREVLSDPDGAGPLGQLTTRYFYDANGNLRHQVNPLGTAAKEPEYTSEFVYDRLDRKIREILPDPDGSANPLARPEIAYAYDISGNLHWVTDARGNVTWYLYDQRNRPTQVTDALGADAGDPAHTTVTAYDDVGNVLWVTDALGRTTQYRYDVRDRKIAETRPVPAEGQSAPVTTYTYDAADNLTSVTDPLGYTTWYTYDNRNRQVSATSASGWKSGDPRHTTVTQYDPLGRVHQVVDPLGRTTTYVYDNLSRKTRQIQPEFTRYDSQRVSPTTYYGYDANGNLQYVTGPLGSAAKDPAHTIWYAYDALNRQARVIDALDSDPAAGTEPCDRQGQLTFSSTHATVTAYDELGNVRAVTDPMGQTTTYVYDHLSRKIQMRQPAPGDGSHAVPVTHYGYDANGNLQYTTSPLGSSARDSAHTTWYVYDALNRQTHSIDALDADPSAGGQPYDAQGQLTFTPNHPTVTVYNAVGQTLQSIDPENNTTQFVYDWLGRLVSETNALDASRSYAYDAAGNLIRRTDRNGRVTEYAYDAVGQRVEERWLDGGSQAFHTIRHWYDPAGQLLGVTESDTATAGAGAHYEYNYDELGNVVRARMAPIDLTQPAPQIRDSQLGDAGEGTKDWDCDGQTENFDRYSIYAPANSSVLVTLTSSSFDPVLYVYPADTSFHLLSSRAGDNQAFLYFTNDATAKYWYADITAPTTAAGSYHLQWLVNPYPIAATALAEFTYTYDEVGNVKQASESSTVVSGLTGVTQYAYDALDRLTQARQSVGGMVDKRANYTYRYDGQFDTITRYADDGTTTVAATDYSNYDNLGRLRAMSHTYGATTRDYTWTYDIASRIGAMTSPDGTSSLTLDATNQLTAANHSYQADESYDYDDNGNRELAGGASYATGAGNQLLSDGTFVYAYDAEGNRTLRYVDADTSGTLNAGDTDITVYAWDPRNRLTAVTHYAGQAAYSAEDPDKVVRYTYDYLDRRIRKTVDNDGGGTIDERTYRAYRGDELALEITDPDGLGGGGAPTRTHRYFYGAAVDQVLAVESAVGSEYWGLADHEGTIRDVVNSAAQSVNHIQYDSFGRSTAGTAPAVDFLFGFAGRPWDDDTSLYDNRARWYDPAVGRWLTEDPAGLSAGDANLYRYAGNSPLDYVDPSGLCSSKSSNFLSAFGSSLGTAITSFAPTTSYLASQVWNSGGVKSALYDGMAAGAYLGGIGAGAIDYTFGTNLVPSVTPTTSLLGGGYLFSGPSTPFQQGVSANSRYQASLTAADNLVQTTMGQYYRQLDQSAAAYSKNMDSIALGVRSSVGAEDDHSGRGALWDATTDIGLGLAQGTANIANAVTNLATDVFNLPGLAYNALTPYTARTPWDLAPKYAWSKDMFVHEPDWHYQLSTGASELILAAALPALRTGWTKVADARSGTQRVVSIDVPAFETGFDGEAYLRAQTGGTKTWVRDIPIRIKASRNKLPVREVDSLVNNIAHESKVGYVNYSEKVAWQILKDRACVRGKVEGIQEARWHFFKSSVTGRAGADPKVLRLLDRSGISYTIGR